MSILAVPVMVYYDWRKHKDLPNHRADPHARLLEEQKQRMVEAAAKAHAEAAAFVEGKASGDEPPVVVQGVLVGFDPSLNRRTPNTA